jgi:hypothetical protein
MDGRDKLGHDDLWIFGDRELLPRGNASHKVALKVPASARQSAHLGARRVN